MTEHKRKWWIIPVVLVLAAVLLLGIFWDAAAVHLAPKAVLTATLTNTFARLEHRFAGSPLLILGRGLNADGKNTIQLSLDTTDDLLGDMAYRMNIQTDGIAGAAFAEGTVTTKGNILDLSLYMDGEFAAISSDSLLEGNYYGITYDTFSEDIRKNQLLAFMLGEKTIVEWEESVADLQVQMNRSYTMPEISQNDISMAMVGILALKAQVEQETLNLNGNELECFAVRFHAEGSEIKAAAEHAQVELPFAINEDSKLTASFYIYEDLVVQARLTVTGPEGCELVLTLGDEPEGDDLTLKAVIHHSNSTQSYEAVVHTTSDESIYSERLRLSKTENGEQESTEIYYDYTPASGEAKLRRDGREVELILTAAEEGFNLQTKDFEGLASILTGDEDDGNSPATITVTKESDISVPKYKNFDQWSMEDLLTLLGGIGSLFGLKVA